MAFWRKWNRASPETPRSRHGTLPPVAEISLPPAGVRHWRDTQRPVQLPVALAPDRCADLAERLVGAVARVLGGHLDYSRESLETVDRLLDSFMPQGSDAWIESIMMAGCYVGEVMIRLEPGLVWGTHDLFGNQPVLLRGRDEVVNPIGKAIKRVELGSTENIPYFVRVMTKPPVDRVDPVDPAV